MRIHSINHDVFSSLRTEAQAYCFGFLLADGWLQTNNKGFGVAVCDVDTPVLEYIRNTCGSSAPFGEKKRASGYAAGKSLKSLYISSKQVASDLIALGLHRQKGTLGTTLPEMQPDLVRHALRGLFDGDGCLGPRQFWLVGSAKLLAQVKDIASAYGKVSVGATNDYPRLWGGQAGAPFLRWLYEECEFALPRKLAIYEGNWKYPRARGALPSVLDSVH